MTMTIEEKAKRYDEALERMKSWVRGEHPECFTEAKKAAEFIFPELKESEDEKIRKELIAFLKENHETGRAEETWSLSGIERWIAWLKKQGEQNLIMAKSPQLGEPKPTDKVEPKFKVGDWISGYYTNYKVLSLNNDGYVVEDVDGDKINILFENEKFHHLFTIADAKDGDVLFHLDSASNGVFIFKEIIDKRFAKEVICYCDYDSEDHFCLGEHHTCCWADAKILHPATKEQRDLLFQKMKEAGYEWDAEKKELKKIKLKSNDEIEHLIPQKGVYYTCIKDYYSSDNTHLYVKGNIYKSSFNEYIDDESHFGLSWTNSCAEKYFEPTKDEDWIVCEHDNVIGKPMQYKEFKEKVNQKFIENLKSQGLTPKLRLWNLQDAKAGDVLVCKGNIKGSNEIKYERICLFNNLDKAFFILTRTSVGIDEYDIDVNIDYPDNTVPATKEQTEILFMVMKNAGYTFNFVSKELRKLSQSEVTKMSDQEEIAEIPFGAKDSELQEVTYFIPKVFHAEIDDDKVVIKKGEKFAAWSEEDNMMIEETLYFLREYQQSNRCKDENGMQNSVTCREWLKSLKQRIGG